MPRSRWRYATRHLERGVALVLVLVVGIPKILRC